MHAYESLCGLPWTFVGSEASLSWYARDAKKNLFIWHGISATGDGTKELSLTIQSISAMTVR